MVRIGVICIGSELLINKINTNVHLINDSIGKIGLFVSENITIPDKKEEIQNAFKYCFENNHIIFITGGLGPTFDDITRESISEILNRKLIFSEKIWQKIEEKFKKKGTIIPEINKKQSYVIEGATIIENEIGTAPGMILEERNKSIILLPGPPSELSPMMKKTVIPYLREKYAQENLVKYFYFGISGIPESVVEEKSKEIISLYEKKEEIEFCILAHPSIIEIGIKTSHPSGEKIAQKIGKELKKIFGNSFLGLNPPTLPEIIGKILKEKKLKLAIAESCTGGLVGKLITDIPGSSEYFQGSFVTYNNILKKRILKVPKPLLKKFGAVSEEVAISMAKGARKAGKADVSIGLTGIAGPGGGSEEKPVGLVWIALSFPKNKVFTQKFIFSGTREQIRERTALSGLDFLRKKLIEEYE